MIKILKSRFFKYLKISLLNRLKNVYKYKKNYCIFPQQFISYITKGKNESIWEEPFIDFLKGFLKDSKKDEIILYLKNDKIGKITLKELFYEYLNLKEFKNRIPNQKNDIALTKDYINDYINNAKNFVNYFTKGKNNSKKVFKVSDKKSEKEELSDNPYLNNYDLEDFCKKLNERNE